jgi:hypothetical protein
MVRKLHLLFGAIAIMLFISMVYFPKTILGQLGALLMVFSVFYFILKFIWSAIT